jgi:hypothetical protein
VRGRHWPRESVLPAVVTVLGAALFGPSYQFPVGRVGLQTLESQNPGLSLFHNSESASQRISQLLPLFKAEPKSLLAAVSIPSEV